MHLHRTYSEKLKELPAARLKAICFTKIMMPYIGLCYRNEETGAYDAWVGMFAPLETEVIAGFDYIDFPHQNLGVCWIYGKEDEVHGLIPQCEEKLISSGMKIKSDEHGYLGHFERDQCPRFTTPDEKGNIILDYCYFVV